jgi:hypothetical protein
MAARDYEDLLQVWQICHISKVSFLKISGQCAIPVFQNLLPEPEPHNGKILRLLFTFAHWHGLAKLRMHTDTTLAILDNTTTALGQQLRDFQKKTCTAFQTCELKREAEARKRRQKARAPAPGSSTSTDNQQNITQHQVKTFNLQTYKVHALGDYVSTIKTFGTTDSYSTAIVSIVFSSSSRIGRLTA